MLSFPLAGVGKCLTFVVFIGYVLCFPSRPLSSPNIQESWYQFPDVDFIISLKCLHYPPKLFSHKQTFATALITLPKTFLDVIYSKEVGQFFWAMDERDGFLFSTKCLIPVLFVGNNNKSDSENGRALHWIPYFNVHHPECMRRRKKKWINFAIFHCLRTLVLWANKTQRWHYKVN